MEKLPYSVFWEIALEQILLLEANPERIIYNLNSRDKKQYEHIQIERLLKEERKAAEDISKQYGCSLHIHQMSFDESDLQKCSELIHVEV